jgi:hypothetical protein
MLKLKPVKPTKQEIKPRKQKITPITEDVEIQRIVQQLSTVVQKPSATEINPLHGQVNGDHYKKLTPYQPWQVMAKWLTAEELKGYMKGTVCAYLCREVDKGGKDDIEKALHTMQIYLEVSK